MKSFFKRVYKNLRFVFNKDLQNEFSRLHREVDSLKWLYSLPGVQEKIAYEKLLDFYRKHPLERKQYEQEIAFLEKNEKMEVFPYEYVKRSGEVEAAMDEDSRLPYVMHCGKRLYFPMGWGLEKAKKAYLNFIENENILGGGYKEKSPHQYQTEQFKVENGDVLVDVGCAEGLFALDVIEQVKKAYLVECDQQWIEPLHKTFEPYKEKVVFVEKCMGKIDSATETTLKTLMAENVAQRIFVKMDIEGAELGVLIAAKECLKDYEGSIKIACCTYHRKDDADNIAHLFSEIGYEYEFSDGYMFPWSEEAPFFRRGILRAKN